MGRVKINFVDGESGEEWNTMNNETYREKEKRRRRRRKKRKTRKRKKSRIENKLKKTKKLN